jgi:hypothetical protein
MVTVPEPDQCPDNPKNGPPEPGSARTCEDRNNIPLANTAILSLIEGDSEKKNAINSALPKYQLRANDFCLMPLHLCNASISGFNAWSDVKYLLDGGAAAKPRSACPPRGSAGSKGKSLEFKELERVKIEKRDQLFRVLPQNKYIEIMNNSI